MKIFDNLMKINLELPVFVFLLFRSNFVFGLFEETRVLAFFEQGEF